MDSIKSLILTVVTTVKPVLTMDKFMFVILLALIIILIIFTQRLNRLEESMAGLNNRMDDLSITLVAISKRPCQLESQHKHIPEVSKDNSKDKDKK